MPLNSFDFVGEVITELEQLLIAIEPGRETEMKLKRITTQADRIFADVDGFAKCLRKLHAQRKAKKQKAKISLG